MRFAKWRIITPRDPTCRMFSDFKRVHRRRFLQVSGAAACGLVKVTSASAAEINPLIDTHVYLGDWPNRRLGATAPAALVALLRQAKVNQAWVGSFDALFHKDIHSANLRLVKGCRDIGEGMLIPVGAINPTLPDWEEDVRRCHQTFKMPGIRLHPTYHGYSLDDSRFARLLQLTVGRNLFVQMVVQMIDERRRLLTPRGPQLDLAPLTRITKSIRGLRVLIANGVEAFEDVVNSGLAKAPGVYFDFSCVADGNDLRKLVRFVSADRVVQGSAAPLFDADTSSTMLEQANLTTNHVNLIRYKNARRLLSMTEQQPG